MNNLEEQTLGRILAEYRNRIDQTGSQVVPFLKQSLMGTDFSYWSTNRISLLENDQTARPEVEILRAFADYYRLTPREYSFVLRAADHPPSEEQLREMRLNVGPILTEFGVPAYVLNYRYELVLWNDAFAALYDAVPDADTATSDLSKGLRSGLVVDESGNQAGMQSAHQTGSGQAGEAFLDGDQVIQESGREGIPSRLPAPDREEDRPLRLQAGMPYFLLLWSRRSRFRYQIAYEEWERLMDFLLVRFWRTVQPLIQPNWNMTPGGQLGEPDWLQRILSQLSALPAPDGPDFAERSLRTRTLLRSDRRDPQVQLLRNYLHDCLFFRQGRLRFAWEPREMADARYTLIRHFPIDQDIYPPMSPRPLW